MRTLSLVHIYILYFSHNNAFHNSLPTQIALHCFVLYCTLLLHNVGLYCIATGLLHQHPTVRRYAAEILRTLDSLPSSKGAVRCLNKMLLTTWERVLARIDDGSLDGEEDDEFQRQLQELKRQRDIQREKERQYRKRQQQLLEEEEKKLIEAAEKEKEKEKEVAKLLQLENVEREKNTLSKNLIETTSESNETKKYGGDSTSSVSNRSTGTGGLTSIFGFEPDIEIIPDLSISGLRKLSIVTMEGVDQLVKETVSGFSELLNDTRTVDCADSAPSSSLSSTGPNSECDVKSSNEIVDVDVKDLDTNLDIIPSRIVF